MLQMIKKIVAYFRHKQLKKQHKKKWTDIFNMLQQL